LLQIGTIRPQFGNDPLSLMIWNVILALGVKVGRMNMKKIRARERTTCGIFLVALFVIATRGRRVVRYGKTGFHLSGQARGHAFSGHALARLHGDTHYTEARA
jgi:hypothetical protein